MSHLAIHEGQLVWAWPGPVPEDAETFLAKFEGGPLDGQTNYVQGPTWPLQDDIAGLIVQVGIYEKVSESQLTGPFDGVLRGALYQFKEGS